jgi:hypothetical protein
MTTAAQQQLQTYDQHFAKAFDGNAARDLTLTTSKRFGRFPRAVSTTRSAESYRPMAADTDRRVHQLMAERPLTSDGRFGCYLIADSSSYSDIARGVECRVFDEFFGNDPTVMTEAYAPYEEHSTFLLVVDRKSCEPAGALRIIAHSEQGLKTLNDIAQEPLSLSLADVMKAHRIDDLSKCWDVGTLAVPKKYRGDGGAGQRVSTLLYGLLYAELCRSGIEHVVAIVDDHAYRQLSETLAVPFVHIADSQPFPYLGSEINHAVYLQVRRIVPEVMRPDLCHLAHGKGLPEVVGVV